MVSAATPYSTRLRLTHEQVAAFLDEAFPASSRRLLGQVEAVALNHVRMRLDPDPSMIRPGGIISGPTLMALADVAAYAVIAAHRGPGEMAVTNSLSIAFLRPCRYEAVYADARLLRLGRRLATVDARIWQGEEDRIIAQSTIGYALPDPGS